jgi:CheY-like chemotaxis protein
MPPAEEGNPVDRAAARHLRVLCAEDHEQVAELLRLILQRAGHDVDCVADGMQALRKMEAANLAYDVLITDHVMPEMDGLALVRTLHARGFAGTVIVQSARLTPVEREGYVALGVNRFIEKPVRPQTLRGLLDNIRPGPHA